MRDKRYLHGCPNGQKDKAKLRGGSSGRGQGPQGKVRGKREEARRVEFWVMEVRGSTDVDRPLPNEGCASGGVKAPVLTALQPPNTKGTLNIPDAHGRPEPLVATFLIAVNKATRWPGSEFQTFRQRPRASGTGATGTVEEAASRGFRNCPCRTSMRPNIRPTFVANPIVRGPHLKRFALSILHEGAGVHDNGVRLLVIIRDGKARAAKVTQEHFTWEVWCIKYRVWATGRQEKSTS